MLFVMTSMDKDGNGDKPVSWSVIVCYKTDEKNTANYLYAVKMCGKFSGMILSVLMFQCISNAVTMHISSYLF